VCAYIPYASIEYIEYTYICIYVSNVSIIIYDHVFTFHEPTADFRDSMPSAPTHSLFGSSLAAPRLQKAEGPISSRRQHVSTVGKASLHNDAALRDEEVEEAGCGRWREGSGPLVQRIVIDQRLGGAGERDCCGADSSGEDDGMASGWRIEAGLVRYEMMFMQVST
jgi:hypothetical protein